MFLLSSSDVYSLAIHVVSGERDSTIGKLLPLPLAQWDALVVHDTRELRRVASALDVRRMDSFTNFLHVLSRELDLCRLHVLLQTGDRSCARNGNEVGVVRQYPRKRDLARRGAVLLGHYAELLDEVEVLGEVFVGEAGQQLAEVVRLKVFPRLVSALTVSGIVSSQEATCAHCPVIRPSK